MPKISDITIADLCINAAKKYNNRIAFEIFKQNQIYCITSYSLLGIRQKHFAALLCNLGIKPGSHVLLLSENRSEWPQALFGIALAGAVCVPVLPESPDNLIQYIQKHADFSAILISRRMVHSGIIKQIEKAKSIPVILIDSIINDTITVLTDNAAKELNIEKQETERVFPSINPDDKAIVFYSGQEPESINITAMSHSELIAHAFSGQIRIFSRDRLLSAISLAHNPESIIGLLRAGNSGALTVYPENMPTRENICDAAAAIKPTIIQAHPDLVFEFQKKIMEPRLYKDILCYFPLTRSIFYRRAGKKLLAALGTFVRCLEIHGKLPEETCKFLNKIRFPYNCSNDSESG
jgi:long-chain acyl-CoA synthetase